MKPGPRGFTVMYVIGVSLLKSNDCAYFLASHHALQIPPGDLNLIYDKREISRSFDYLS